MVSTINITFNLNGWTVNAGCQNLVYTDQRSLLNDLTDWLADPQATEKRILEKAVNHRFTMGGGTTADCGQIAAVEAPRPRLDEMNVRATAPRPR